MESFRVMDLPRELRDNIYEHCLVVPGDIVHYPEYYSHDRITDYKDRKLTGFLSLLYVSKQVYEEASPIFYSKNTFRITATGTDLRNGGLVEKSVNWSWNHSQNCSECYHPDTVWARKGHLIRHARVCYHQQDVDPRAVILRSEEAHKDPLLDREGRLEEIHEGAYDALEDVWKFKGEALSHLGNLNTLDIDIKSLYCVMGCCRDGIVELLWNVLNVFLLCLPSDLEIRIYGVRGKKEDDNAKKWCRSMRKYMKEHKAEKMKKAKANMEKAAIEMGEAEVGMEKAKANMEKAKANMEKAKANMEEAMKQRDQSTT